MRAARQQNQKLKRKQQYQDGDTGLESLSSGSQGNLNLGLRAWAQENGIDIDVGKKMKPSRDKGGALETGLYVLYSLARHPSEYHMKDLVLTTPLTVKYMADYEYRTKHPLWLVQHASFDHPNIIRTTAMKKARRALLAALKRNHYLPNGKAFADDLVRGTELYGTIKIWVKEPLKTVNTPMAKLASFFDNNLNKEILVAMRRRVIKKLRPDRASPASGFPPVVKPVFSKQKVCTSGTRICPAWGFTGSMRLGML